MRILSYFGSAAVAYTLAALATAAAQPAPRRFVITSAAALGDGQSSNTRAIQNLIDKTAREGGGAPRPYFRPFRGLRLAVHARDRTDAAEIRLRLLAAAYLERGPALDEGAGRFPIGAEGRGSPGSRGVGPRAGPS